MKLLILTQKVDMNDDILGFFHRWILEFAKHCEQVTVICLEKGEYDLPENVQIYSLGKEKNRSRLARLFRLCFLVFNLRSKYDTVFVHMNPEYLVFAGVFWKLWKKKTALWYTHRAVNLKLRIASFLSDIIFTSSSFSFNLKSKKLIVIGHGIETSRFACAQGEKKDVLSILSVGRITPIKRFEVLIKATEILVHKLSSPIKVVLVGSPSSSNDRVYKKTLEDLISVHGLKDTVSFYGSVPNRKIHELYCQFDAFVNMAPTGGVDKVVLEGMASGRPVFASNKAFNEYFDKYAEDLVFEEDDAKGLASRIYNVFTSEDKVSEISIYLKNMVQKKSDIKNLIPEIIANLARS